MIENSLLFYLTRREIPRHLFFSRTRVGSLESQFNVAINVKNAVAKSTCVMFKVPGTIYCKTSKQNNAVVAVFFFLPSFNKLKRSEKTFTMGMKNRNEEEKDFLEKKN